MKWAIKVRYLESQYTGDGKWHQKTTKWYINSNDAWKESDSFIASNKNIIESASSLCHKGE